MNDQNPEQAAEQDPTPVETPVETPADTSAEETLAVPLTELRPALEALLMVADQPMDHLTLASAVGHPADDVAVALTALTEEYAAQGRGFDLRCVAGGWRFYTRDEFAPVVERYVRDGQQARLTQAALETLAVVAYKQPVSRARVSAVRGVNVDGVMRTLLSRGLVEETGQHQLLALAPAGDAGGRQQLLQPDQPVVVGRDRRARVGGFGHACGGPTSAGSVTELTSSGTVRDTTGSGPSRASMASMSSWSGRNGARSGSSPRSVMPRRSRK